MKTIYFLTLNTLVLLFGALSCQTPAAPSSEDEAAIRQLMSEGMTAAWEQSDKSWIESTFLEDADVGFPNGPLFSGKANLPVSGGIIPKGRKFNIDIQGLRFLSPDIALVNNNAHFTGGKDDKGNAVPDSRDAGTFILKKAEGKWKVAALRVLRMRNDPEQVKTAIRQALEAFSTGWKNNDARASVSYFTEDAINFRPDAEPDLGREAILKMSEGFLKSVMVKELEFNNLALDIYGDHAYELGTFKQHFQPRDGGKAIIQIGRYNAVWRFEGDGQWRMKSFLFNLSPGETSK